MFYWGLLRGEASSGGGSHRSEPEIGPSGAGRSAVYGVMGPVGAVGWIVSLRGAFSSATEAGIPAAYRKSAELYPIFDLLIPSFFSLRNS